MKQTSGFLSTYSADAFGICSALFELGGLVVMHDASGCNSTYTTHDEPRWYDMDSMVYISGLTEIEAIMGDDSKLISDVVDAAKELKPKFIAIVSTTIPAMTGFDADAAANVIEAETGIPSMGFKTTGMNSYVKGADVAFVTLAERFVKKENEIIDSKECSEKINILGLTPLDFSINGSAESIKLWFENKGYSILSTWAMGSSLEDISGAGKAGINYVVSSTGIGAAKKLKEIFGTEYRVGLPIDGEFIDVSNEISDTPNDNLEKEEITGLVIGESVTSAALAKYLTGKTGVNYSFFASTDSDEDEITELITSLKGLKTVIADPLFERIIRVCEAKNGTGEKIKFVSLPHEAYSGRLYRNQIPNLVKSSGLILDRTK